MLLAHLEGGDFDRDLSAALISLLMRMGKKHRESGGKPAGRIIVSIDFTMLDGVIATRQSFKTEPADVRTDTFFPTKDGLTQRSPYVQEGLGFGLNGSQTMRAKGSG